MRRTAEEKQTRSRGVPLARHVLSTGHMWIAGVECPFNGLCFLTLPCILSPRVPRCLIAVNSWLQDSDPFLSLPHRPLFHQRRCHIFRVVLSSNYGMVKALVQQLTSWEKKEQGEREHQTIETSHSDSANDYEAISVALKTAITNDSYGDGAAEAATAPRLRREGEIRLAFSLGSLSLYGAAIMVRVVLSVSRSYARQTWNSPLSF